MAAVVVSKINLFNPCVDRRDGRIFNLSPSSSSCNGGGERGNRILELKPLALMRSSSIRKLYDRSMRVSGTEVVLRTANSRAANAKMSLCVGKAQRWWEKKVQANMEEVTSAQHLVDSLSNAGEKLVILDFFSPGCGGCKALHPKICQLAEMNPDIQFLQVNYEEHKSMCYSLNVHVLPFFRFYRGAQGRLCSFSCTNATIKKFKDALAKYSPDRCSLGPAKGLDEKEMLALASNRDLSFIYTPNPREPILAHEKSVAEASKYDLNSPFPLHVPPKTGITRQDSGERSLVTAGG